MTSASAVEGHSGPLADLIAAGETVPTEGQSFSSTEWLFGCSDKHQCGDEYDADTLTNQFPRHGTVACY